jgi:hypothetical protein
MAFSVAKRRSIYIRRYNFWLFKELHIYSTLVGSGLKKCGYVPFYTRVCVWGVWWEEWHNLSTFADATYKFSYHIRKYRSHWMTTHTSRALHPHWQWFRMTEHSIDTFIFIFRIKSLCVAMKLAFLSFFAACYTYMLVSEDPYRKLCCILTD